MPAWINNYIHYNLWGEIIFYSFPNVNGATLELWEWIGNFIPYLTGHVITYPDRQYRCLYSEPYLLMRFPSEIRICLMWFYPNGIDTSKIFIIVNSINRVGPLPRLP